jgi:hypothetical protein
MALIVEDGTGKVDAEAYASVADVSAYLIARGNVAWNAITSDEKEQSIRRATDYITSVFGERWQGSRTSGTQALDWPRADVIDRRLSDGSYYANDSIPSQLIHATAELALRAAAGPLFVEPSVSATGLALLSESHKVGPIEDSYRYASKGPGATQARYKSYEIANTLLRGFLVRTSGVLR